MANKENVNVEEEFDERREARRKRRIRNQIIAYAVTGAVLTAIVICIGLLIHNGIHLISDKKTKDELQEAMNNMETEEEVPVTIEAPPVTDTEDTASIVDPLEDVVNECIAAMPLEDKIAGLFMITCGDLTGVPGAKQAGSKTEEGLKNYAVGGLVYFGQNISSADQLKEMLEKTKGFSKYRLFLAVEEEGGSNSTVAKAGLAENVGNMGELAAGEEGAAKVAEAERTIAAYLSDLGFNVNLAPVADVVQTEGALIGNRSFGSSGSEVGGYVASAVTAMQEKGISACLKSFPGNGDLTKNTADGAVSLEKTREELETNEFLSFLAGIEAGADMIMISNAALPVVSGADIPSSVSDVVITDILRTQLGYNGIVITGAMNEKAITDKYSPADAAVAAIKAGADMILMPESFTEAYQGLIDAVNSGMITEERIDESLKRIYRVKFKDSISR